MDTQFTKRLQLHTLWVTSCESDGERLDASGENLRNAYLPNANFEGARLRGVDFRNANLSCANFIGADLRGSDLRCARLKGADFFMPTLRALI